MKGALPLFDQTIYIPSSDKTYDINQRDIIHLQDIEKKDPLIDTNGNYEF